MDCVGLICGSPPRQLQSHHLNSSKGVYGVPILGLLKGDTRRLDYSSHGAQGETPCRDTVFAGYFL